MLEELLIIILLKRAKVKLNSNKKWQLVDLLDKFH